MELEEYRSELNEIDAAIDTLLRERFTVVAQLAQFKQEKGLPIRDLQREKQILSRFLHDSVQDDASYRKAVWESILAQSCLMQRQLIGNHEGLPRILVIHGPNMTELGAREPELYGEASYAQLLQFIQNTCDELGCCPYFYQSNHEGDLVDAILAAKTDMNAILINPAAYTHTSVAIADALRSTSLPAAEVHLTDITSREPERRVSLIRQACCINVSGEGFTGYQKAICKLCDLLVK